ncbi:RNA polymerase III, subunit C34 [Trachipleistophora hominis]|uniref:RNA polymerase III, subunit C34 n=1 Tax=Trachipleistophora hominis TaxID=72359 RepID=L7JQU3_TRAHO|nr:RNA polymerase III, subunit C34 [Trachipleistophora hominis]
MSVIKQVFDFIQAQPDGVTEEDILKRFPDLSKDQLLTELTKWHLENRIKKDKKNKIMYVRNTEDDEKSVLDVLKKSKGQGCTIRDIRLTTKLSQNLITKILRKMQDMKMVKAVKGQKNRQNIFMVFEETPDDEVTGGIWFNNGDVDVEFTNQLIKLIYTFVRNKTRDLISYDHNPTIEDIKSFITESNVLSINISMADLRKIIDVMVYGQILLELRDGDRIMYRALRSHENEILS